MGDRALSTGDYLFLAFLKNGPRSSYDLKKEMTSSINFFWYAQHSQVYQQANRLRRDGYVEPRGATSSRNRQLLALTERGSAAVDETGCVSRRPRTGSTTSHWPSSTSASLSGPDVTHELLLDQRHRHAELLAEFEQMERVLDIARWTPVASSRASSTPCALGIGVERAYLGWIDQCLADLHRRHSDLAPRSRSGP